MVDAQRGSPIRIAILIPSVYGGLGWGVWLALYSIRLVAWEPTSPLAEAMFVLVLVVYIASATASYRRYKLLYLCVNGEVVPQYKGSIITPAPSGRYLLALHGIGFLGLALYIRDFAAAVGGFGNFVRLLLVASYAIRWQGEMTSSIGTQLSYFGWIAIGLTALEYRRGRVRSSWLLIALVQFVGNLMFIDRTRPIWIVFTTVLPLIAVTRWRSGLYLVSAFALVALVFAGIFLGVAIWVGKVVQEGQFGASPLPSFAQGIYVYGTAGFAYFNHMINAQEPILYWPERVLYPLFKVLSTLGVTSPPPSQVNPFYYAPFPTNVGTFLEPFYRDGGLTLAAAGMILHSFGFDLFGHELLRNGRPLALFAWANLCFVNFIAFFTPKITTFPVWLFTCMGIAALWRSLFLTARTGLSKVTQ